MKRIWSWSALLIVFRIAAFIGLLAWAYYIAVITRTTAVGFSVHVTLLMTLLFAGPTAGICFQGLAWKRYATAVLVVIIVPAVIAETQATLEERMFVASVDTRNPNASASKGSRWWPAGDHYMYYAEGRLHGGD